MRSPKKTVHQKSKIIIRHLLLQNSGKEYRQPTAPIELSINKKTQDCVGVSRTSYITIKISSKEIQFVQNELSVTSKTFSDYLSCPAGFLNCQAWTCHTNGFLFTPALNMSLWVITHNIILSCLIDLCAIALCLMLRTWCSQELSTICFKAYQCLILLILRAIYSISQWLVICEDMLGRKDADIIKPLRDASICTKS